MSFKDLELQCEYRSPENDVVKQFYTPILSQAKIYKRSVGFFSSSSLVEITYGIKKLVQNGGKICIVASPKLSEEDIKAIQLGYEIKPQIIEKCILQELDVVEENYFKQERLNLLANLIANGIISLKIAFTKKVTSIEGMYHEKLGVFEDFEGNKIVFDGSMNESTTGFRHNVETINAFCSWKEFDIQRANIKIKDFENIWNDADKALHVIDFPSVTQKILDKYKRHDLTDDDWNLDIKEEETMQAEYPNEQEEVTCKFSDSDKAFLQNTPVIPKDVNLYNYQMEAIENWQKQNYRGIFDMATGTGKTLTGLGAVTRCSQNNNNLLAVIIVAPYQHLVEQWVEDIERFNIKPIIAYSTSLQKDWKKRLKQAINDQELRPTEKGFFLLVTTNATFKSSFVQKQIHSIKEKILLVIDEAHNAGAGNFKKHLDSSYVYRLALSATLDRHNDVEGTEFLHNYFGEVCIHYDLERAIDEEKLTPYKYYPILVFLTESELSEYKQISNELFSHLKKNKSGKMELDAYGKILAIQRSRIVAGAQNKLDVFRDQISPYKEKNNILVYCGATTVLPDSDSFDSDDDFDKSEIGERQIIAITKILGNEMNMSVSRFTSEEDIETRKTITQKFKDEDLQAIVAIKCLDEGVNIPSIKTAFILASTTNPKEYIQRRGRVLRKWPGKEYAELYDFVTLPRELETVCNFTKEEIQSDLSLVKNELRRIKEFSSIAMNKMDSLELLNEIQEVYQITDKDLSEKDLSPEE